MIEHDQGNLQKEKFIWAYGSREIKVHPGREARQQEAGMVPGGRAGNQEITSSNA